MSRTLAKEIAVSWLWFFGFLAPAYLALSWIAPALFPLAWYLQIGEAAVVASCWASVPPLYKRARAARRFARQLVSSRVVIEYRDAFNTDEWCTFPTIREASAAVDALNAAYEGKKRFWIQEASLRTVPGYLGSVPLRDWHGALPVVDRPAPRHQPHARPKPGTPIVRQRNGRWYVQTGHFEIGYGSGEEGYRAALSAVERAHQQ